MCVVSNTFDGWEPLIPHPTQPDPLSPWWLPPALPWKPLPTKNEPLTPEELRDLLKLFGGAVELARKADAITGQPDCEDPEKAKLRDRVAELEKRLDKIEAAEASEAKTDPPSPAPVTEKPAPVVHWNPPFGNLPPGTTIKYDPNTWTWVNNANVTCTTTCLPLTFCEVVAPLRVP